VITSKLQNQNGLKTKTEFESLTSAFSGGPSHARVDGQLVVTENFHLFSGSSAMWSRRHSSERRRQYPWFSTLVAI